MLDEHAVSRFKLGPVMLKNQLMRFAKMEFASPVAAYMWPSSLSWNMTLR